MHSKKATISDVAHLAGVGKTSVSRYLNGEFEVLSVQIRQKIASAIQQLDYRPSQVARSMKRGKTKLIALILTDLRNPYSIDLLQGVEAACQQAGYTLLLFHTNYQIEQERRILQSLLSYQVEGIISQAVTNQDSNFTRYPQPIVSVDRAIYGVDCDVVSLDNEQAAGLIADHLLQQQIQSVLFVSGNITGISPREQRVKAVQSILKNHPHCRSEVAELDNIEEPTRLDQRISQFYRQQSAVKKAIISVNGITTLNVALSLKRLGIQCGAEIALIGFDDAPWSPVVLNGISTVKQPTFEMGYKAFELLLARINGNNSPAQTYLYPGKLITRQSTLGTKNNGTQHSST